MGVNQRSQITMSDDEIAAFIERSRTATMATIGPTGVPHVVVLEAGVDDGNPLPLQEIQELLRRVATQAVAPKGPDLHEAPRDAAPGRGPRELHAGDVGGRGRTGRAGRSR